MPVITKPANIQKNVPASFSLNKADLVALPSVAADAYFSDTTNWNQVLLFYRSSVGNQKEVVKFDATQASPTANFLASAKARDVFQIQKILISDFDNGIFEVPRSALVTAEFDIDFLTPVILAEGLFNPSWTSGAIAEVNSSQSFALAQNSTITEIELYVSSSNQNSNVVLSLKNSSNPAASIISQSSSTVVNQTGVSVFTWVTFTFPPTVLTVNNWFFHIASVGPNSNGLDWAINQEPGGTGYPFGSAYDSTGTALNGGRDAVFRVKGTIP